MKPLRLTLNEARARSVLARQGRGLSLELGARWAVALQPLPLAEAPADWAAAWTLAAEWGGARFAIRVNEAALTAWAEAASAPALQFDGLPPELLALAFEQAWRQLADALVPLRRGSPRLLSLQPGTVFTGLPHRIAATLERADGQARIDAEIATDALGLLLAAGTLAQRPAPAGDAPANLPLRCRLELGRTLLPARDARSLRTGDLVIIHERWCETGDAGTMRLVLTTQGGTPTTGVPAAWRIELGGGRVHLIDAWSPPVTATAADNPASDTAVSLDAVPVSLSFDLGELLLPLAELRALAPGQSFDLGRPLAAAVQVRANGALIGWGELLEIDGRLGVALTQIGSGGEGA